MDLSYRLKGESSVFFCTAKCAEEGCCLQVMYEVVYLVGQYFTVLVVCHTDTSGVPTTSILIAMEIKKKRMHYCYKFQ